VDYAQILVGEGFNKQEKVSDVSARMKGVAMKHGIRVILLAQLNRDIDKRPDPTPQLADIRDSAAMGMDADVVLMPFWPKRYDDTYQDASEYRIYCRKNRNRGIREDLVMMKINFARQRAETLDREREDSMSGM
jgi:replicative DNA helicase